MINGNMSKKPNNRLVTENPISSGIDMHTGSAKEKRKGDRRRGSSMRSRSGSSNDGARERNRHASKRQNTSREVEKNNSTSSSSRRRRDIGDKWRHRRRSSSTSSSKDSRSRSSYAAGDRKTKKKKNRRKDRRSGSDDSSDRCIGGSRGSAYTHASYKFQEPNKTIMVRGLAFHHTENDIKTDVQKCGLLPKDIRLIRSRDTGESRGFAFVEFFSVVDATRWMDIKKGVIVFCDQYQAYVIYSNSKGCASKEEADWYCEKCCGHNFKRREFCYKCYSPRKDGVGQLDINSLSGDPTSTIVLSNLDTLTTEADVLQAFQLRADVACLPIKSVKIARELVTTISKGICYVEANCISEAISLFSVLSNEDLIIDGRKVYVAYSKTTNVPSQGSSNAAAFALAAAQWTNSAPIPKAPNELGPPCVDIKTVEDVQKMAEYYAKLYAKTFDEYSSYFEYYRQYFGQEILQDSSEGRLETAGLNPRLPSMSSLSNQFATAIVNPNDSVVVVPGSQSFVQAAGIQDNRNNTDRDRSFDVKSIKDLSRKLNKRKEQKGESNTKVTDAQRITKKMEKWAKTLNEKKDELMKKTSKTSVVASSSESSPMSFDQSMALAMESDIPNYLEENYVFGLENSNTYQPVDSTLASAGNSGSLSSSTICLVDKLDPNNFVDESKLVCLLCKRRFSSKDVLQKHVTKSDMHQKNLSELRPIQRY